MKAFSNTLPGTSDRWVTGKRGYLFCKSRVPSDAMLSLRPGGATGLLNKCMVLLVSWRNARSDTEVGDKWPWRGLKIAQDDLPLDLQHSNMCKCTHILSLSFSLSLSLSLSLALSLTHTHTHTHTHTPHFSVCALCNCLSSQHTKFLESSIWAFYS